MEDREQPAGSDRQEEQFRSRHSTRAWRACCLVPMLVLVALLIFSIAASLYSGRGRNESPRGRGPDVRKQDFIDFGKAYFAIAYKADKSSKAAFDELRSLGEGKGSIERVHDAFRQAAVANGKAAEEFRMLDIPQTLTSQSDLNESVNVMSQAYTAKQEACEVILSWNGDENDRTVADKYMSKVHEIHQLSDEGLRHLVQAANDNGLTRDDIREFAPKAAESAKLSSAAFQAWLLWRK